MPEERPPPFAGRTGRGIRVGVIDSGAHPGHPHLGRIAGGVAVTADGRIDADEDAWLDRLGHGTAVTAAIQEKAPEADYFAVKVFDGALRTTGAALVAAIDWCLANGMDILNLSLGSTNPRHEPAFALAAERALAAGAVLVSARAADGLACYPGALPTVLGVDLDWDCPREGYRCARPNPEAGEVFYASGYPRPIPGVPPRRNLYGVSFAVANLAGFAVLAREAVGRAPPAGARADLVRQALRAEASPTKTGDAQDSANTASRTRIPGTITARF